ncbi:TolB family protein [Methanoplanus endosymbiosus]|uniref:Uncharacterized protein n=1 Tax=Methanoplanus endosymbiosus TaxID=33865 RepID=A0A9E7TM67_9EURY|nr:hypothetical protein [Methanoplanus endosymbiosus]UUX93016.1 hypothetical protein L6E24_02495 [Methanoplanus endosymbiosus]
MGLNCKHPVKFSIPVLVLVLLCSMLAQSVCASQTGSGEEWTVEDMMEIAMVTDVCPSSDGTKVIYTVIKPLINDTKSEMHSQAYEKRLDGSKPRLLLAGEVSTSSPRWSPDETKIAFLSDSSGTNNIWVVPSGGGEATQVTNTETPVISFA